MDLIYRINRFLSFHLTPAVKKIFVINCLVFLAIQVGFQFVPNLVAHLIHDVLAENPALSLRRFFLWQFLTYMFVHADGMHILFNMVTLWFFAPDLEDRWGSSRFWRFYLTTGIGAGIFHSLVALVTGREMEPIIGASGALFGVLFAFACYYPYRRVYIYGLIPVLMMWLVPGVILIELFALRGTTDNISHITHLSGVLVAFLYLSRYHRTTDFTRWRFMS